MTGLVEIRHVLSGGTDAERVRLPKFLECLVHHADRQCVAFDIGQTGLAEQLDEVTLAAPAIPDSVLAAGSSSLTAFQNSPSGPLPPS